MGIRNCDTWKILMLTRDLTLEQAEAIALANEVVAEQNSVIKNDTLAIEAGPSMSTQSADSPAQPPTSHHISNPGTSQGVYIFSQAQANLITTSNPQPLSYPALVNTGQPNQGPIKGHSNCNSVIPYRDASYFTPVKTEDRKKIFLLGENTVEWQTVQKQSNYISPAQDPTSHHNTSMPGTSQDLYNIPQDSPNKNTQACLTTTSKPQPISFTTQGTPSTSHEGGQIHEQSLVPIISPNGKKYLNVVFAQKNFLTKVR